MSRKNETRLERLENLLDYLYPIYKVMECLDNSCRRAILEEEAKETGGYRGDGANDPDNRPNKNWKRVMTWDELTRNMNKSLVRISNMDVDKVDEVGIIQPLLDLVNYTASVIKQEEQPEQEKPQKEEKEDCQEDCEHCPDKEICMLMNQMIKVILNS